MNVRLRVAAAALTATFVIVGPTVGVPRAADRPTVAGPNGAVSAGHPLTSAAAFEVLLKGGNAFDAGVAAMLVGGVVEQDLYSLGGEGLVLVYPQRERKVTSIVGQGWAPKGATIEWYTSRGKDLNGIGLDPAVVPGVVHAALTVLERWGTMTFEQVSVRAVDYAARGFPLRPRTADAINNNRKFIDAWPDNKRTWVKPDGTPYKAGDTIKLPDLARTLSSMVEAERKARKKGRVAGIAAARDLFYKGDIAREMVAFLKEHQAPWELDDFSEYFAKVEQPAMTTYRGYDVYKQSFGSQGPVLLESLNILEQFDLKSMKRNSGPYLHTIVEAMKLAYADRDSYYADQVFVQSPAEGLLSKDYAKERAKQIDAQHASKGYLAGDPLRFDSKVKSWNYWIANLPNAAETQQPPEDDLTAGVVKDTTHISVIDRDGNVFDSTPSGAWLPTSPILGKTGIAMSVRGESFWLDPSRAAQLRPRSRPRYTLTPTIVLHDGQPFLAIGTPGGDNQEQTILQAFLNIVEFWPEWYPNLHQAFRWPRVQTLHFYGSFWPHPAGFNKLNVESDMPEAVYDDLKTRGHDISKIAPASIASCATAVLVDPTSGNRIAGADPRRDCYAMAY
ncbi:MAG TPA: gamma-glutamyltransferase family protein [Vicinamibacterales bacterium]|jgi:gamma-glutamyltranspeptidase / glutathione hydrolase|nr:gamma-glutamyltransferase family protein [Vicinamibacterales bacterium]